MKYILLFIIGIQLFSCNPPKDCSYALTNTFINKTSDKLAIDVYAYNRTDGTIDSTKVYNEMVYLNENTSKSIIFKREDNDVVVSNQNFPTIYPNKDICYNLTDTSSYTLVTDYTDARGLEFVNTEVDSLQPSVTYFLGKKVPICYFLPVDNYNHSSGEMTIIIDDEFVKAFMKKDYTMLETFKDYYK